MDNLLRRLIPVEREELKPVLTAVAYGFCILLSYYILRPVRDEISSADRGNLRYLWTAVFFVMLVAVPLYSAAVSRFSRGRLIPWANRFFALNILGFFAVLATLQGPEARAWIDRVFYVWTSVFALFVVTVFWGFIADLYRNRQGRRVFGLIAMGSSLGGIAGSSVTALLADRIPVFYLLLIAVIPLEIAAWLAWALDRNSAREGTSLRREDPTRVPGNALSGIRTVFESPYLRGIALFMLIMTFASTVLYYQQADLIRAAIQDRGERTSLYAQIDLATNILTIGGQSLLAAHLIRKFGVGITLAILPIVAMAGFVILGSLGVGGGDLGLMLAVLIVLQVVYRAGRYAIARPAREVLYTVVGREERYKSKAFLDAAVYRGGDLGSAWVYDGLAALGLSVGAISLVAAPVLGVWAGVGIYLGRQQEELADVEEGAEPSDLVASG